MKILMCLFLLLTISACSSSKIKDGLNDVKLEIAKTAKVYTVKELKAEYSGLVVHSANCESEAEKLGLKMEERILGFLKAEQRASVMVDKSLSITILPVICNFVVSNVVPELLKGVETEYVCLSFVGSDKLVKIGKDLCDQIK